MNNFLGKLLPLARIIPGNCGSRALSVSAIHRIKEIQINSEGSTLTVTGVPVDHPKKDVLVMKPVEPSRAVCTKDGNSIFCPECSLGLEVKHTDVLILSQYLRSDGCMLPRRITGLCKRQQRRIGIMVTMAQKAGLMPNIAPSSSKRDPAKRFGWKKYNKYFDEKTIPH